SSLCCGRSTRDWARGPSARFRPDLSMATSCAIATVVIGASVLGLVAGAGGQGRSAHPDGARPSHPTAAAPDPAAAAQPSAMPSVTSDRSALIPFDVSPFPYDGALPDTALPFFDVMDGLSGRRGHTTTRGDVLWEPDAYRDRRVLLHVPASFDPARP